MKKLIPMLTAIICCFFISCQKESIIDKPLTQINEEKLVELKNLFSYESKLKASLPEGSVRNYPGSPQWEKARNRLEFYIVPIKFGSTSINNEYRVSHYWIVKNIANKLSGKFVHILEKTKLLKVSLTENERIKLLISGTEKNKLEEEGIAVIYEEDNINGNFDLVCKKRPTAQISRNRDYDISNSYPLESCVANGGTIVEIEWWYQIYDQFGNVIYEEYVFSTFECWGAGGAGDGGGGGGTTIVTPNTCNSITQQQVLNLINQLEGEEEGDVSYTSIILDGRENNTTENFQTIRKMLMPKVSIFTLRFLYNSPSFSTNWTVHFGGISYKEKNNPWKWESINYISTMKTGQAPFCFEADMSTVVSNPLIQPDKTIAKTTITYSLTAKVKCLLGWEIKNYTGSFESDLVAQ